jgi:hypothetical protein
MQANQYPQPTYGGGQQPYNASAPPPNYGGQQYGNNADYYNGDNNAGYNNNVAPPPHGPPQNYGPPQNVNPDGKQDFSQAFKIEKPRFNDLWAGILLILTFLGFTAVSIYCITNYGQGQASTRQNTFGNTARFGLTRNTIGLFGYTLVVATVLSIIYFAVARLFTKQVIWISGILNILAAFAAAGYLFYARAWAAAVIALLIAIFTVICFVSWIPRIPFSVLMFQTVVDVSKRYRSVYIVSAIGGILMALFGAWFAATLMAVYARFEPSNPGGRSGSNGNRGYGAIAGLFVFVTFAGYWISEWLKNTIHVTISGVYGSWYVYPIISLA